MILTRGFSVPVRPQLRLRVDRQFEAATSGERRLCGDLRHEPNEPHRRFLDSVFAPRACEEEEHDVRTIERSPLVRSRPDVQICGDDCPSALFIKRRYPIDVGGIFGELVALGDDLMLALEKGL